MGWCEGIGSTMFGFSGFFFKAESILDETLKVIFTKKVWHLLHLHINQNHLKL